MLNKKVGTLLFPVIGLGTYDLLEKDMMHIIGESINNGVNFFDSANRYNNESNLGSTIKKLGINRTDYLIGTKLSYRQQISQSVEKSVDESLKKLQVDYIDMYMIHSPKSNTYCKDWIVLQKEKEKGKILELGVSNFSINQLNELYQISGLYPILNQIEVNFTNSNLETIEFCKKNNIIIQASCPLCRMNQKIMNNNYIQLLMEKYNRTYPQIALRWLFQRDLLSIPKMSSKAHLNENIDIFDFELLTEELLLLSDIYKGYI